MNLDELRTVRRTERQKDSLQHLRDSFYEDVAEYVAKLKSQRQAAADAADDPFSDPEVGRLTDEIETAEDIAEAIYERRVGKVVKLASFEAADMSTETNGLTAEERELFDDLVTRIRDNRGTVLDTLAGATTTASTPEATPTESPTDAEAERVDPDPDPDPAVAPDSAADPTPESTPADPDDVLAEAMGGASDRTETTDGGTPSVDDAASTTPATSDAPAPDADRGRRTDDTDRTTLRITRDVGEIFCVDEREYELARDDVVTLPTANAEPLLDRDAAERLE